MKSIDLIKSSKIYIDEEELEGNSKKEELQDGKGLSQKDKIILKSRIVVPERCERHIFMEKLVSYAKQGDTAAEETIITSFKPLIYSEMLKVRVRNFDYDDLEQIGYITVMLAIRKYTPDPSKGNFIAYVSKCVRNRFLELVRRNAKYNVEESIDKPTEETGDTIIEHISDDFCLEDKVLFDENMTNLYTTVQKLPEKYRKIILDCVLKDISMKNYAKDNNLTYRVVVQRKHRAVLMLRELMIND